MADRVNLMNEAREKFLTLSGVPDERINVAEAALWIAQEEYPGLDVVSYLRHLDFLASEVRCEIRADMSPAEQVSRLNHFLFAECGFTGNHTEYYDPRNSFLNEVMDRRLGIPLTLSLVYCEVAQRIGVPVRGIGFPGHFLCKYVGAQEIIIDPFFHVIVGRDECMSRLRDFFGPTATLDRRWLEPATAREVLVRMLSNLKQIYVERNDSERALGCTDRILLLTPDAPRELRDRGLLYQRLECFAAALHDLERYLRLAPHDETADLVREILPDLQRRAAQVQ